MLCGHCGSKTIDGANVCPNCGAYSRKGTTRVFSSVVIFVVGIAIAFWVGQRVPWLSLPLIFASYALIYFNIRAGLKRSWHRRNPEHPL